MRIDCKMYSLSLLVNSCSQEISFDLLHNSFKRYFKALALIHTGLPSGYREMAPEMGLENGSCSSYQQICLVFIYLMDITLDIILYYFLVNIVLVSCTILFFIILLLWKSMVDVIVFLSFVFASNGYSFFASLFYIHMYICILRNIFILKSWRGCFVCLNWLTSKIVSLFVKKYSDFFDYIHCRSFYHATVYRCEYTWINYAWGTVCICKFYN